MFKKMSRSVLNFNSNGVVSSLRRYAKSSSETELKRNTDVHQYKRLYPWKSKISLADHLHKSIVHHADGLIAVNKPYGIGIQPPNTKAGKIIGETLSSAEQLECGFHISDALPELQNRLDVKRLRIIKSPERYSSGIMLLASEAGVADKVRKSIEKSKAKIFPPYLHWAITNGIPLVTDEKCRVGLRLIDIPKLTQKVAIIEPTVSNKAKKAGKVIPATVEMKVASSNYHLNCALIEISTTTMRHHFLRVYLAHQLAPILGDSMYSSRVKTVLGKPVMVSPTNAASCERSKVPSRLCDSLHLPMNNSGFIPTHLHLYQMTLTGFNKGTDVVIVAPPPDYLMWSLEQLALSSETRTRIENIPARLS